MSYIVKNLRVRRRWLGDAFYLLRDPDAYRLSPLSDRIWRVAEEVDGLPALAARVCVDLPGSTLQEIDETLQQLASEGLLSVAPAAD